MRKNHDESKRPALRLASNPAPSGEAPHMVEVGITFDPESARLYTVGRIVRVVEKTGCPTCGRNGAIGLVYANFKDEALPQIGVPFGGFAVLFEHGLVEGFSLEQASWWLAPTPVVYQPLVNYQFDGLSTMIEQWNRGVFECAFEAARKRLHVVK